jgi:glyoxylase-like metal-dependent hydrolase (beta-lactamase superfamily II)
MPTDVPYAKGLHQVADDVWAYLQPDGGWGWSNAGLITSDGAALLVDTLFDIPLTEEMLGEMRRTVPAAASIGTVVNTHANGDHCYGNAAVGAPEIVASAASAVEFDEVTPAVLAGLVRRAAASEMGAAGDYITDIFGGFAFEGIEVTPPTRTFTGTLDLAVGDKAVQLIEVGPAHTQGDVIVVVPDDGVVFTGDILFHGGHPVVWAGPVSNWIAACDRILGLPGLSTVVAGHGPLAGLQAVEDLKGYFEYLTAEARQRFDAGMSPRHAAYDIDMSAYAGWGEPERVVVNVNALYRDFGANVPVGIDVTFGQMAAYRAARSSG